MSTKRLARKLAEKKHSSLLPAQMPSRALLAAITKPGNNTAAGRSFMEAPDQPPLSQPR